MIYFVGGLIKSTLVPPCRKAIPRSDILFYAPSVNNDLTLREIYKHYSEAVFLTNKRMGNSYPFPRKLAYIKAMPYFPLLLAKYFTSSGYQKRSIATWFHMYWLTYGYYIVVQKYLESICPKVVVIANDHTMSARCFLRNCQEKKIKIIYVQHASVNEAHPALDFDFAFLDGMETLEKYMKTGTVVSTVFLTGAVRFMKACSEITNGQNSRGTIIGIAYNLLDDRDTVKRTVDALLDAFPDCNVVIRPHPADKASGLIMKKFENERRIRFSDSKREKSINFLLRVDFLVSNMSSIHLEAAYLGIPSIVYSTLSKAIMFDPYQYLRNGLVKGVESFEDLKRYIEKPYRPAVETIKYYLADYQTSYQQKTDVVHTEIIDWILGRKTFPSCFASKYIGGRNYYVLS